MLVRAPYLRPALMTALLLGLPLTVSAAEPRWKQHVINPTSEFEAADAFDVDGDGKLDVVSGDAWYKAPDWTRFPTRSVARQGTYYNCFATLPMDVNGDKKTDYVTAAYFTRNVGWVENPGKAGAPWTYHEIDQPGPSESAQLVDLTGDGVPEVLPNAVNTVVWYRLEQAGPNPKWRKYDFGTAAAGHGVGSGDVNGDGRVDLLTPKGWFEAPEKPADDSWTWHPDWQLGATGIQILAKDVDGDRISDIIFGMGHNYGLSWLKQGKSADGKATWTRLPIDERLAQAHTLMWADLDGDGAQNELVTGKRVYAHEVEPGDIDAPTVAYYRFNTSKNGWDRFLVFEGQAAKNAPKEAGKRLALKDFPPQTAGTGLQVGAVDLDGDGDIDLVCPGKSGLYWFENVR